MLAKSHLQLFTSPQVRVASMFSGEHKGELDSRLSQQESIFGVKFSYEHMGMEEEGGHQSHSLEREDGAAMTCECAIGLLRFPPRALKNVLRGLAI